MHPIAQFGVSIILWFIFVEAAGMRTWRAFAIGAAGHAHIFSNSIVARKRVSVIAVASLRLQYNPRVGAPGVARCKTNRHRRHRPLHLFSPSQRPPPRSRFSWSTR